MSLPPAFPCWPDLKRHSSTFIPCCVSSTIPGQVLSARLGFTYNITAVNSSVSSDSVVASVADGTFDIAASGITIKAAQMDFVSFSYPYYSTSLSFVYRKGTSKVCCNGPVFSSGDNTVISFRLRLVYFMAGPNKDAEYPSAKPRNCPWPVEVHQLQRYAGKRSTGATMSASINNYLSFVHTHARSLERT